MYLQLQLVERIFLIILIFVIVQLLFQLKPISDNIKNNNTELEGNEVIMLQELTDCFNKRNISREAVYFIDFEDKLILDEIAARYLCNIESALYLNPDLEVYLILINPGSKYVYNSTTFNVLINSYYNRFKIIYTDFLTLKNESKFHWYFKGLSIDFIANQYRVYLPFLLVYTYGGTYMDLDIMLIKRFDGMYNFISADYNNQVSEKIFNFEKLHYLPYHLLLEIKNNYKSGYLLEPNGKLFTQTFTEICDFTFTILGFREESSDKCHDLAFLPYYVYFLIKESEWNVLLQENNDTIEQQFLFSTGLQTWQKYTKFHKINKSSNQFYKNLANDNCPSMFKNCYITF